MFTSDAPEIENGLARYIDPTAQFSVFGKTDVNI